ncbi:MAG: hypothetical protein HRT77_08270 [Halioglobus sp.]|nr:hypothetical protein [Halioglobus sp.]
MTRANNQLSIHLPSGAQASFEEMQAYGNILQSFICKQEALLQEIGDVDLHNETVDYLHSLASGYNRQLQVYKEAERLRQRETLAAVLRCIST